MFVLGISCFYHDAAAALLQDGAVLAAAEEERFSRVKHDHRFPTHAIQFCLEHAQINTEELDYVVFYEKPELKFDRVMGTLSQKRSHSNSIFKKVLKNWGKEKLWIIEFLKKRLGIPRNKILFSEHHLSHVAHAFFLSPFEEAATLTVDGVGEWVTTSLGEANRHTNDRSFVRHSSTTFPHSLGLLYSAFTEFLGFEVNEGEYKVMGMAPYGTPRYKERVEQLFHSIHDDSFELNMDYFAYEYSSKTSLTTKFTALWGEPREPESTFIPPTKNREESDRKQPDLRLSDKSVEERSQYYADVAASVQSFVEDILLRAAKHLHRTTGLENLCLSGGVANNSVANGRIIRESGFKNVYVPPGPGDSGAALGAALAAYSLVRSADEIEPLEHPYLGKEYSDEVSRSVLKAAGYKPKHFDNTEELTQYAAEKLAQGKVIGWHQGRFEFGPRALGRRSILADPRKANMQEAVNKRIKFREMFRPFAPACLKERACNLYELNENECSQAPYRYMQSVVQVQPNAAPDLEAVTHVDGSARLQVVDEQINPPLYSLLKEFEAKTGIPVLLNTSFNRRGEPIVSSPQEALTTYEWSGLDALVVGHSIIER